MPLRLSYSTAGFRECPKIPGAVVPDFHRSVVIAAVVRRTSGADSPLPPGHGDIRARAAKAIIRSNGPPRCPMEQIGDSQSISERLSPVLPSSPPYFVRMCRERDRSVATMTKPPGCGRSYSPGPSSPIRLSSTGRPPYTSSHAKPSRLGRSIPVPHPAYASPGNERIICLIHIASSDNIILSYAGGPAPRQNDTGIHGIFGRKEFLICISFCSVLQQGKHGKGGGSMKKVSEGDPRFDMNRPPLPITAAGSLRQKLAGLGFRLDRVRWSGMAELREPCLVLVNSPSPLVFRAMAALIFPHPLYFAAPLEFFIGREEMLRETGAIGVRRYTQDIRLIRHLSRAVGEFCRPVAVSPDSGCSLYGREETVSFPGRVARMLGCRGAVCFDGSISGGRFGGNGRYPVLCSPGRPKPPGGGCPAFPDEMTGVSAWRSATTILPGRRIIYNRALAAPRGRSCAVQMPGVRRGTPNSRGYTARIACGAGSYPRADWSKRGKRCFPRDGLGRLAGRRWQAPIPQSEVPCGCRHDRQRRLRSGGAGAVCAGDGGPDDCGRTGRGANRFVLGGRVSSGGLCFLCRGKTADTDFYPDGNLPGDAARFSSGCQGIPGRECAVPYAERENREYRFVRTQI